MPTELSPARLASERPGARIPDRGKRDIRLNFYDRAVKSDRAQGIFAFDKVLSMTYSPTEKSLMSTVKDGRSDISLYTILSTSVEAITDDIYDDLDPVFVQGSKRILFRSNRSSNELDAADEKTAPSTSPFHDLFIANRRRGETDPLLWRITQTPDVDEDQPQAVGNAQMVYVSAQNGFRNTYRVDIDSSIAQVDTIKEPPRHLQKYRVNEGPITILLQKVHSRSASD